MNERVEYVRIDKRRARQLYDDGKTIVMSLSKPECAIGDSVHWSDVTTVTKEAAGDTFDKLATDGLMWKHRYPGSQGLVWYTPKEDDWMHDLDRDRFIYPDVIAETKTGEGPDEDRPPIRYFAGFTTNNMDTVVRGIVYWYTPPEDADNHEPVLVVEIDDEDLPDGRDNMDIKIRVRRNDGLVYEGTRANQENLKETA